jgi:hypothetical protein
MTFPIQWTYCTTTGRSRPWLTSKALICASGASAPSTSNAGDAGISRANRKMTKLTSRIIATAVAILRNRNSIIED